MYETYEIYNKKMQCGIMDKAIEGWEIFNVIIVAAVWLKGKNVELKFVSFIIQFGFQLFLLNNQVLKLATIKLKMLCLNLLLNYLITQCDPYKT